jgi:hypothetical protein
MKKINLFLVVAFFNLGVCTHASNAQNTTQDPQNTNGTLSQQEGAHTTQVLQTQNQNHQAGAQNNQVLQTQNQKTVAKITYPDLAKKTPKQIARYNHCLRLFESCYIKTLEFSSGIEDENIGLNLSEQEVVDIATVFAGLNKKGEKFTIFGNKTISNYLDLCVLCAHVIKELEDKSPGALQNK